MKLTIKFDLDQNVHSTNELTEASKYLKLLSEHIDKNFTKKKLNKIIGSNQPIHTKNKKAIGYYKFENKVIQKKETESEIMQDMGEWSRKHFGYTKNGYFHFDGKKTKINYDDDSEEWED
tara:strand:+ start:332 stop:691 length:360 start_codon:yes stop_codon:yes gene_type:complete